MSRELRGGEKMQAEQIIHELVRPLTHFGVYKNETMAIKDIVTSHIEKKIENYNALIQILQKKYGKDFELFTKNIKNRATPELEDDWMEWKGAIEMRRAWNSALKEVIRSEARI